MLKYIGLALPPLAVAAALMPVDLSSLDPFASSQGAAQAATAHTVFQMPAIARPNVAGGNCTTPATIRLTASTPAVQDVCVTDGKILVNGSKATGFVVSDVLARNYGPLLRGVGLLDLKVERVTQTGARADPTLGLGLVNVSDGIGQAIFHDLVWIGDTAAPAINSDDAWAAIALKGKDANDVGTFEIRNFDFQNLFMKSGTNYANVDGISTEAGYSGTISDGRVMNASDACLDIKGDVRVDNVHVSGCREGLKIWTDQKHGLIELGTNSFVGIIGKGREGTPRRIDVDVLIATGNPATPLFRAEDGPVTLHIGRLVSKPDQVLNSKSSFAGSQVVVDQRSYN